MMETSQRPCQPASQGELDSFAAAPATLPDLPRRGVRFRELVRCFNNADENQPSPEVQVTVSARVSLQDAPANIDDKEETAASERESLVFVGLPCQAPEIAWSSSEVDHAKELCSRRRVFASAAFASFMVASVAAMVLADPALLPQRRQGHPNPGTAPSSERANIKTTLRRIPVVLPPPLRRATAVRSQVSFNRSSADGLLQGIAQDIEQEARARTVTEWVSQGGLIDVPARSVGPQCKHGSNCEWEVVSETSVRVRQSPDLSAHVLDMKYPGAIVVGRAENDRWLRLVNGAGFMALELGGSQLLKQREDIWYEKIINGSCADAGRRPILDARSCEVAAMTLGLAVIGPFDEPIRVLFDNAGNRSTEEGDNTTVTEVSRRMLEIAAPLRNLLSQVEGTVSAILDGNLSTSAEAWDDGSRPEGCYMDAAGTLRMNLEPSNIGNGALGDMEPICATMSYPSTKTTTSTTMTRSYGTPSLLCFSYMRPQTVEEQLIKEQMKRGAGIFACDRAIVISSATINLGVNQYGENVTTLQNPPTPNVMGNMALPGVTTNSWLNTLTFIDAFNTVLEDPTRLAWNMDFIVKVDPDAVLLPDRLRSHVSAHVGMPVYFLNCGKYGTPVLYGALEIFSKEAMRLYKDGHERCKNELPWKGWGEDSFMSKCMAMLSAKPVSDFGLVGDARCAPAPCTDTWRAAFHPFKDVGSWEYCWRQATNIWD